MIYGLSHKDWSLNLSLNENISKSFFFFLLVFAIFGLFTSETLSPPQIVQEISFQSRNLRFFHLKEKQNVIAKRLWNFENDVLGNEKTFSDIPFCFVNLAQPAKSFYIARRTQSTFLSPWIATTTNIWNKKLENQGKVDPSWQILSIEVKYYNGNQCGMIPGLVLVFPL